MKILKIINVFLISWVLSIFLYRPFLSFINCDDRGWPAIRNLECGNIAYIYDIFANTFLLVLPLLILPITLTVWLFLNSHSKKKNDQIPNPEQGQRITSAIKLGMILFFILFCLGAIYLMSQFSTSPL